MIAGANLYPLHRNVYPEAVAVVKQCVSLVVTHFALRSFTVFRMTTTPYVILSGSEESLLLSPNHSHHSK